MGREAVTRADVGDEAGEVRALLESTDLILRGGIRRRFVRDGLARVRVEGDALRFECGGEAVALHLGAAAAAAWAKAIAMPPPSLGAKLGIGDGVRAFRVGPSDDAALEAAVAGALAADIGQAGMLIARVDGPADLDAALAVHAARPGLPLWVVYPKGRGVAFGDGEIRAALRSLGFRDSKSCAVSDRLTATRYGQPKAADGATA